jgi:hypothetical protein
MQDRRLAMSPANAGAEQQTWPWPDSLDAIVAAPDHHTVVLENEQVRVLRTRILPGQTVPVHTHCWPSVQLIVSWSDLVRRDHLANVMLDTRTVSESPKLNTPLWHPSLAPHSVENVGVAEIHALQIEIKGGPSSL